VKALVLGGTQFVGRAIVEALLDRGHEVVLFHRGKTGPDLFPNCRHILGDRTQDIGLVTAEEWDVVFDVSAYTPDQVRASAQIKTSRYLFISTISVYDTKGLTGPLTEATPLLGAQEGDVITGETYGPLKVRCEEILAEALGERLTVVRPGIVFGPYDPTGRFPYWVTRLDGCDRLLVPNTLDQPMQWIDSRDLANFSVHLVETSTRGTFNGVGPKSTFGEMLDGIRALLNHRHDFVLASREEITRAGLQLWVDLPLIFPTDEGRVTFNFDPAHALAAGLKLRSLADTAKDTLDWARNAPLAARGKYGMTREKELAAMEAVQFS
jgi:2'-hydroxyisoflavone reductase